MIEGLFRRSFERVARNPPTNTLIDALMLGWWRIQFTESLIARELAQIHSAEETEFWRDAQLGEAGHAALYEEELRESLGGRVFDDLARHMAPCPAVEDLLVWVRLGSVNHVVYRAWLEYAASHQGAEGRALLARFIPKSVALHAQLDADHVKACYAELERRVQQQAVSVSGLYDKVQLVEMALRHELSHRVFPPAHWEVAA
jgi:hypothetical protein